MAAEVQDNARNLAAMCCTGVATTLPRFIAARVLTNRSLATTVAINSFLGISMLSIVLRVPKTGPNLHPIRGRKEIAKLTKTPQWM